MKRKIPGIHHPIEVRFVSGRYLRSKFGMVEGIYQHHKGLIYVDRELVKVKKAHTFCHELAHHILDSTEDMNYETRCDVIGKWLIEFANSKLVKELIK